MLEISISKDEELQEACNIFISALLPHEKFDPQYYTEILQTIFRYIRLDEFSGEYFVLLSLLEELRQVKLRFEDFTPNLTKEILSDTLEVSVVDSVLDPRVKMTEILDSEGLPSNLKIETNREGACQKLYSMVMELWETCYGLEQDSSEVLSRVPLLRSAFLKHVSFESVQNQIAILQGQVQGASSTNWLEWSRKTNSEIVTRLEEEELVVSKVDSVDEGFALLESLKSSYEPLAQYGIPEIDYSDKYEMTPGTPILKHRLVVLVGAVNVGKSMFCIWQTARILAERRKVIYMYGESSRAEIYAKILLAYIWVRFGKNLLIGHVTGSIACTEEIDKIITMAIAEIGDLLLLRESYSYDGLYEELAADYEKEQFDALFIDHSFALAGLSMRDNGKSSIDKMSISLRNFKRKYPVFILVASHPSTDARSAMTRGTDIKDSPTKGSSNLFGEADEVFVLRTNEALQKQDELLLENKKRRNAPVVLHPVVLRKRFSCYCFDYDAILQYEDVAETTEAESALAELDRVYMEDGFTYDIDAG